MQFAISTPFGGCGISVPGIPCGQTVHQSNDNLRISEWANVCLRVIRWLTKHTREAGDEKLKINFKERKSRLKSG
jgi:hypothetical protein